MSTDHLGSVTEVANASGTLLGQYNCDPWGRRAIVQGTDITSVGYTGHTATIAIVAAEFRAYDPGFGRWLSEYPARLADGANLYSYVGNRPLNHVDPDGQAGIAIAALVGGIVTYRLTCWRLAMSKAVSTFPSDDKKQHCYAACFYQRCTLFSNPFETFAGQVGHEGLSLFQSDPVDDTAAAVKGIVRSYNIFESCEMLCRCL